MGWCYAKRINNMYYTYQHYHYNYGEWGAVSLLLNIPMLFEETLKTNKQVILGQLHPNKIKNCNRVKKKLLMDLFLF
jgi:hypothetical protein